MRSGQQPRRQPKRDKIMRKTAPEARAARPKISEIFGRAARTKNLDFRASSFYMLLWRALKSPEIFEPLGSPQEAF